VNGQILPPQRSPQLASQTFPRHDRSTDRLPWPHGARKASLVLRRLFLYMYYYRYKRRLRESVPVVYWKCARCKENCRGRLKTDNDAPIAVTGTHNHPPDPAAVDVARARDNMNMMKERAATTQESTHHQIRRSFSSSWQVDQFTPRACTVDQLTARSIVSSINWLSCSGQFDQLAADQMASRSIGGR